MHNKRHFSPYARAHSAVKPYHLHLTVKLCEALDKIIEFRGGSVPQLVEFYLRALLPVAQAQRFQLSPRYPDFSRRYYGIQPRLTQQELECVNQLKHQYGVLGSELLRRLVWVGVEFDMRYRKHGALLKMEDFVKLIIEDLKLRWSRIQ